MSIVKKYPIYFYIGDALSNNAGTKYHLRERMHEIWNDKILVKQ